MFSENSGNTANSRHMPNSTRPPARRRPSSASRQITPATTVAVRRRDEVPAFGDDPPAVQAR